MAFQCVVVTPEQQMLDESARQAIVPAHDGQVGILTDRAPILMRLGVGRLKVDLAGGGQKTYLIDGGIAQMKDNKLTILTDAAWLPEDLDSAAAKAEYDEAAARQTTEPKATEQRMRIMRRAQLKQEMAKK